MSEVVQRWRLMFARDDAARFLSHLDAVRLWERAFRRGDIPVATTEGFTPRSRLIFAAPLQLGMLAEHELADLYLSERLAAPDLRRRLAAGMPPGYRILDLHDVWIGAPALAPQLAAADYRMILLNVDSAGLEDAAERLMAADRLPRERRRETRTTPYDLRPLLLDLRVRPADAAETPPEIDAPAAGLWMRLRHSQNLGSGRADEVVAALAEQMGRVAIVAPEALDAAGAPDAAPDAASVDGTAASVVAVPDSVPEIEGPGSSRPIEVVGAVRERLWLADELAARVPDAAPTRAHGV
jgi:radical SAM-linked protein